MADDFSGYTLRAAAHECRKRAAECLAKTVEAVTDKSRLRWHAEALKMERAANVFDDQAKHIEKAAAILRAVQAQSRSPKDRARGRGKAVKA